MARTYAAYHRRLNAAQALSHRGLDRQPAVRWGACRPTRRSGRRCARRPGRCCCWDGELFPAFYHTDSGGYTEDPRVVFAAAQHAGAQAGARASSPSESPHSRLDARRPPRPIWARSCERDGVVGRPRDRPRGARAQRRRSGSRDIAVQRHARAACDAARQRLPAPGRLRHAQEHALRGRGRRRRSRASPGAATATASGLRPVGRQDHGRARLHAPQILEYYYPGAPHSRRAAR